MKEFDSIGEKQVKILSFLVVLLFFSIIIVSASATAVRPAFAAAIRGPIENPANGHLYYAVGGNSWTGAETDAQLLGGHLVTINDAAENKWVWETFAPLVGGPLWIGMTDVAKEGTFVWTSGEPANYFNWWCHNPTECEPNGSSIENYVEMNNYVWNDNSNNPFFIGIVEVSKQQEPPPKPPTAFLIIGDIVLRDRSSCMKLSEVAPEVADATASNTSTANSPAAATTAVVWNSTTATCVIAHGTIVVSKSASITISSSTTLEIANSAIFQNNGTVNSVGTIKNAGEIKNFGTISSSGIIENRGLVENSGTLGNSNTIDNFGVIDNNNAGRLVNSAYIIIHHDTIDNSGGGGKITGSGTIINSGYIVTR